MIALHVGTYYILGEDRRKGRHLRVTYQLLTFGSVRMYQKCPMGIRFDGDVFDHLVTVNFR